MKCFSILTLGCKVNQYETQQIRQLLEQHGLTYTDVTQGPDLVVINTCCVTHTASAKSRHALHQVQKHRPAAIVVCGCLPLAPTDELAVEGENIHVVKHRCDLTHTLDLIVDGAPTTPCSESSRHHTDNTIKAQSDAKVKRKKDLCTYEALPPLARFRGHTRAYLKIQDGCDAFCTYCIIPTVRPHVRFKKAEQILAEARALVASGHKEIVVTGVHIGAYGQDTVRRRHWATPESPHLPALLEALAAIPDLARIRLSSLDPADVTAPLLDVFCRNPNLMPHLHLSLQSGSDHVLHRMCRPYTAADFLAKVDLITARLDRPAITTDIIVGFPGETDADFEKTVALARRTGFAKMHVFAFSPRKGTAATKMQDKLSPAVIKERSRVLRDLDVELQSQFRAQFVGKTAQVLIEAANSAPSGRAERYFTVQIEEGGPKPDNNTIASVRILRNGPQAAIGVME